MTGQRNSLSLSLSLSLSNVFYRQGHWYHRWFTRYHRWFTSRLTFEVMTQERERTRTVYVSRWIYSSSLLLYPSLSCGTLNKRDQCVCAHTVHAPWLVCGTARSLTRMSLVVLKCLLFTTAGVMLSFVFPSGAPWKNWFLLYTHSHFTHLLLSNLTSWPSPLRPSLSHVLTPSPACVVGRIIVAPRSVCETSSC